MITQVVRLDLENYLFVGFIFIQSVSQSLTGGADPAESLAQKFQGLKGKLKMMRQMSKVRTAAWSFKIRCHYQWLHHRKI